MECLLKTGHISRMNVELRLYLEERFTVMMVSGFIPVPQPQCTANTSLDPFPVDQLSALQGFQAHDNSLNVRALDRRAADVTKRVDVDFECWRDSRRYRKRKGVTLSRRTPIPAFCLRSS